LRWICEREGIQADPETFSVLAQVGEGSVRDSLSALDQAIACCGTTLNAAEVRNLLPTTGIKSYPTATCCSKISLTYKTPLHILNARKSKVLSMQKTIKGTSVTRHSGLYDYPKKPPL
jgi:hypothetical protein